MGARNAVIVLTSVTSSTGEGGKVRAPEANGYGSGSTWKAVRVGPIHGGHHSGLYNCRLCICVVRPLCPLSRVDEVAGLLVQEKRR